MYIFFGVSSFAQGEGIGGDFPSEALSFGGEGSSLGGGVDGDIFKVGGHLKSEFYTLWDDDEEELGEALKPAFLLELRLKGHWNIEDGLFVHTEFVYLGLYGSLNRIASLDRLGFLELSGIDKNDSASFGLAGFGDYKHSIIVDQAYFSASFEYFAFSMGRQVLGWGTGYFVNPTDKINSKDFLRPEDQLPGTTSIAFQFNIYQDTGIRGYISVEDRSHKRLLFAEDVDFSYFPLGVQARTTLWGWDFSLGYLRDVFYNQLSKGYLKSHYVSFDFSGELELGIYGEFAFRLPGEGFEVEDFDDVFEGVVGIDYIFGFGLSLRFEYYRNGSGGLDKGDYDLANILSGGEVFLGKDYFMLYMSKEWLYTYRLSFLGIVNIGDGSFVLSPDVTMTFFDNLSLSLGSYLVYGSYGSEFDGRFVFSGRRIDISMQTFYFKTRVSF